MRLDVVGQGMLCITAVVKNGSHAVAHLEAAHFIAKAHDGARAFHAWHKWPFGLHLVLAGNHQGVWKVHARAVHINQHLALARHRCGHLTQDQ